MKRTHHCNALRPDHAGQTVTLTGWVHSRRDLGGVIFLDIRDREGRTQTVFDPSMTARQWCDLASGLHSESVVEVTGQVRRRPSGTENPKIPTGQVEVVADSLVVQNRADVLPFQVDDPDVASKVNEELRLKYRYLDLRRPEMIYNLRLRSKVATATRVFMEEQGFLEIETPTLFKSTPEGAREFIVPNRREPGTFYALPQSPQQFKQILMVGGVERYFQLARCYRDEDLRADRQPEFTQIDIEMSFIEREDIYALIEGLLERVWKAALNVDIPVPFKRMSFEEALNRYGIDKPDTRFGMELADLTGDFEHSAFKVFSGAIASGGVVKALNAKGLACATQGQIETMTEYAKSFGAKGLAFIKVEGGEWKSPIVKFFSDAEKAALQSKLAIEEGDLILFAADQWLNACEILGKIRLYCAEVLQKEGKLRIDPRRFDFLWVVDFPLLAFDKEQNRWYSSHHPFTAPVTEDVPLLKEAPKRVRGQHYDIVVNGVELGGGSIRIHQRDVQKTVFEDILQISPEETQLRFGYMLEAFRYGAPPHGGIALGFDRLIAILCGTPSIRDVIAFPKTAKGTCLMTESPAPVTPRQLKDLYLEVKAAKKTPG
ncbi:MAG: aspartate--tRNA ligase [Verrucomicrobia bacterium]|jgi:aspartyl-tRNA synthetase|nr:aspartate--tRNA ligase [Verrucomicrobiota bacterium]